MRDYARISPRFWIGGTGKAIRAGGVEAQLVALYLVSSPHSNMLGLYYLPRALITHETGLSVQGASKGLRRCIEAGFCAYDDATETVWVYEMALYQIGETLKPDDKRCKGIQREYDALPENPFLSAFFEKFKEAFHLVRCRTERPAEVRGIEAPYKPHRSQDHEQEHEQAQEQEHELAASPRRARPAGRETDLTDEQFEAFKTAYPRRGGEYRWAQARTHVNAALAAGETLDAVMAGVQRYAAYIAATGDAGTQFVKTAAVFASQRAWREEWTPPTPRANGVAALPSRRRKTADELEAEELAAARVGA